MATHRALWRRTAPAWLAVGLLLVLALVGRETASAFSAVTGNPANSSQAGTVTLSDDDSGSALFSINPMGANNPVSRCIRVTYTGSLASRVWLYGSTGGTGLDQYLNLKVTRGTLGAGVTPNCTGFSADATNYQGLGAGVIYNDTLRNFGDDWAHATFDAPATWAQNDTHAYQFTLTLQANAAAQSLSATQTFTWEARNAHNGYLTQLGGIAGCASESGSGGACYDGKGLTGATDVVISPDGKHAYASARDGNALSAFARDQVTGALTQLAGTAGCWSETGDSGACADGVALQGPQELAISPDGSSVYVASVSSNAVAVFSRNATTGALTQLAGTSGCLSTSGTGGACTTVANGVAGATSVTVSPDGANVYVTALGDDGVAVFARNSGTGALTQLAGTSGCVTATGNGGSCAVGTAINNPYGAVVSPDGKSVYVTSDTDNSVAAFTRTTSTGALTQLSGTSACVSDTGSSGACVDGNGLDGPYHVAVSPDNNNVYVESVRSNSLTVFSRNPSTSAITQLSGTSGCISDHVISGCLLTTTLNYPRDVIVSPDGEHVYVASELGVWLSGHWTGSVVTLSRDASTGALTELAQPYRCLSEAGNGTTCVDVAAIRGAYGLAFDPNGSQLYVAARTDAAVAVFARG